MECDPPLSAEEFSQSSDGAESDTIDTCLVCHAWPSILDRGVERMSHIKPLTTGKIEVNRTNRTERTNERTGIIFFTENVRRKAQEER
jgi:hypothetical protein